MIAGCRITSIQRLLGHRRLNATMVYARVHDQTVAEDYYAAMETIERRLETTLTAPLPQATVDGQPSSDGQPGHLLALVEALDDGASLNDGQRELVCALRSGLLALAGQSQAAIPTWVPP